MSNLWAVLLATNKGSYPFEIEGETVMVDALNEARFDRLAGKYPFGLTAQNEGKLTEGGCVWVRLQGSKQIDKARAFYRPPTVLFTKGAKGVALWAVKPSRGIWEGNEALAKTLKTRVKDSSPLDFRLDIRGHTQEWRMDALYDLDELVSRCVS